MPNSLRWDALTLLHVAVENSQVISAAISAVATTATGPDRSNQTETMPGRAHARPGFFLPTWTAMRGGSSLERTVDEATLAEASMFSRVDVSARA
jgi:hypothetical protein